MLSEKGVPTPVAWTRMRAPRSLMGAIGSEAIRAVAQASPLQAVYGQTIDRESAHEMLSAKYAPATEAAEPPATAPQPPRGKYDPLPWPQDFDLPPMPTPVEPQGPPLWEEVLKNPTVKSAINTAAREFTRSIFGTGRRRRK